MQTEAQMETTAGLLSAISQHLAVRQEMIKLARIPGDASARCYYRCYTPKQSFIIMQQSTIDQNFLQIAQLLKQHGLPVPEIYHIDTEQGFLLLSDLGDELYLRHLPNQAGTLYQQAITALLLIQQIPVSSSPSLAPMDAQYLESQSQIFSTWFLQEHLGLNPQHECVAILESLQTLWLQVYNEQPQVLVHLDYHSRNLLWLPEQVLPGILDFQDARSGPITYDLASLLQDAYISWPPTQVHSWLAYYYQQGKATGLLPQLTHSDLIRWFNIVGLQRHLKNLGVFARLYYRDHKPQYLPHINTLFHYIQHSCQYYQELHYLLPSLHRWQQQHQTQLARL
jgi:aminoglycoside/choline kinase family phosphotransferase